MRAPWAELGEGLRVVDGDDLLYLGVRYRLEGYDAPEVTRLRSKINRDLERKRGHQAMLRLVTLIAGARYVHLIPGGPTETAHRDRRPATLLINGQDVAKIAVAEGWGVRLVKGVDGKMYGRQENDWGDDDTPFPNHFPLPDTFVDWSDD